MKKSIAYCGLDCTDCFVKKGKIADLSRDLRKELRKEKFDKVAKELGKISFFKELKNYDKCYSCLGTIVRLRCRKLCRDGGGNPFCKVRKCCQKKKLKGCWQCKEFETCKLLKEVFTYRHKEMIKKLKKMN